MIPYHFERYPYREGIDNFTTCRAVVCKKDLMKKDLTLLNSSYPRMHFCTALLGHVQTTLSS